MTFINSVRNVMAYDCLFDCLFWLLPGPSFVMVLSWLPLSKNLLIPLWLASPCMSCCIRSDFMNDCISLATLLTSVASKQWLGSVDSVLFYSSIDYTELDGRPWFRWFHSPRQNVYSPLRHRTQATVGTEHHGKFQDINDHERFHTPLNKILEHLWSLLITLARSPVATKDGKLIIKEQAVVHGAREKRTRLHREKRYCRESKTRSIQKTWGRIDYGWSQLFIRKMHAHPDTPRDRVTHTRRWPNIPKRCLTIKGASITNNERSIRATINVM